MRLTQFVRQSNQLSQNPNAPGYPSMFNGFGYGLEGFDGGGRILTGSGGGAGFARPNTYGTPRLANGDADYFTELGNMRTGRTLASNTRLTDYGNHLTDDANAYETGQSGLISGLESRLGGVNSDYERRSTADILDDERARKRALGGFAAASRLGQDMAIADGTRSAKAMFANKGGGGSSYASRLGIGLRMRSEADAAAKMSDLERSDNAATSDARSRLRSTLFGANRGDVGTVFGERSRLSGNLFDVRRGNVGTIYGEGSRISGSDAAMERDDLFRTRYIQPIQDPWMTIPSSSTRLSYPVGSRRSRMYA